MKTINQSWEEYRRHVVPANASEAQVRDMRRTFMAGAYALMGLLHNHDDAEAVRILEGLSAEMKIEVAACRIEALDKKPHKA
jgi:hypothetical protein